MSRSDRERVEDFRTSLGMQKARLQGRQVTENDRNAEPYFYTGGNPYVCQFEQHSDCQEDGHSDHCRFIAREAEMIREAQAKAWTEGHAEGRDYAGDGWNGDAHDPEQDNPYRVIPPRSEAALAALAEDHGCIGEVEDTGVMLACRACTERVYPPESAGEA